MTLILLRHHVSFLCANVICHFPFSSVSGARQKTLDLLFSNRLLISAPKGLDLFNKKGLISLLEASLEVSPSVRTKSLQTDTFSVQSIVESKFITIEKDISVLMDKYIEKAVHYCGSDLTKYDEHCNKFARTRTEFSHMQRQVILICPVSNEGQSTKENLRNNKKIDKINNFTYIVNPRKIYEYERLTEGKKLSILGKQILRYSAPVNFKEEYKNQQVYFPVADGMIEPWAKLKLRRIYKTNSHVDSDLVLKKKVDKTKGSIDSTLEKEMISTKKKLTSKASLEKSKKLKKDANLNSEKVIPLRKSKKKSVLNDIDNTISKAKTPRVLQNKKVKEVLDNEFTKSVQKKVNKKKMGDQPLVTDQLENLDSNVLNTVKKPSKKLDKVVASPKQKSKIKAATKTKTKIKDVSEEVNSIQKKPRVKKVKSSVSVSDLEPEDAVLKTEEDIKSESLSDVGALKQKPKKKSKKKSSEDSLDDNNKKDKKNKKKSSKKKLPIKKKIKKKEEFDESDDSDDSE